IARESTFSTPNCRTTGTNFFQCQLMKNLAKFLLFVLVVSAGISLLYDYRLKHGGLKLPSGRTPEKYTLASEPSVDSKQVASLEALNRERRALVSSVVPSVVAIKASKRIGVRRDYGSDPFEFFFGNRRHRYPQDETLVQNSLGSGVIVTNEGHIITNSHVVSDGEGNQVDQIEVQLSDGRTKKARLIGADSQLDLAVLKIDNPSVKPLKLADSDTVQPGDFVVAIGNPFGLQETVTDGIISWKGQPNSTDFRGDLLQTNAAINPGNSGGPLINLRGEVVGINEQIVSSSGGSQGIGFAIPSNTVRAVLESVLKHGRVIRGYLGIVSRALQSPQGPTDNEGVVVDQVMPGSPAAQAKLQQGDVIEEINQQPVTSVSDYTKIAASLDPSQPQVLSVCRHRIRSFLVLRPR